MCYCMLWMRIHVHVFTCIYVHVHGSIPVSAASCVSVCLLISFTCLHACLSPPSFSRPLCLLAIVSVSISVYVCVYMSVSHRLSLSLCICTHVCVSECLFDSVWRCSMHHIIVLYKLELKKLIKYNTCTCGILNNFNWRTFILYPQMKNIFS